jgi:chitinase
MSLLLVPLLAVIAQTPETPKPAAKVFVGYLYGRPENIDFSLYTHICHAFVTAGPDGKLNPGRNVPDPDFVKAAHKHNVKVLLSLGGWGWDEQFAAIAQDPAAENRYLKAVVEMLDTADYDGIDLDWEYPDSAAEVEGFERLTRRFRKELDTLALKKCRPMQLTMAAAANPGTLRWLDTAFLSETMDWINVMTYDMAGDWSSYAGHNAPLFASSRQPEGPPRSLERTIDFLLRERKLPPDRIALGIPLYGRGFSVKEPYASTKGIARNRIPGGGNYANLKKLLDEQDWTRQWDHETKTPWLLAPDRSTVIGYDDVESVIAKTKWAVKQGLRGVFFWQIHGDRLPDNTHPLQEAAKRSMPAPVPSTAPGPG